MASQILNNNSSKAARAFTLMIEEEDAKIIHQNLRNSIVEEEAHSVIINKAEEFIVQKKFDSPLYTLKRARSKNPNLSAIDKYYAAYAVHKLATEKKSWYTILGIQITALDFIKSRNIRSQQKYSFSDHQQDQCPSSVMIDSAEKLINGACDVLSDPIRRESYNMLMGYRLLRSRSLGKPYPILGQRFYYLISFCFFFFI